MPIYDAKIQGKEIDPRPIRSQPFYVRERIRVVLNIISEANWEIASRNKALGVYDFSNHIG